MPPEPTTFLSVRIASQSHATPLNVLAYHFNIKFDKHFVEQVLRSRLPSNLQI